MSPSREGTSEDGLELSDETPIHVNADDNGRQVNKKSPSTTPGSVPVFSSRIKAVRHAIAPLLPPPALTAMDRVDPVLQPYVGDEGSIQLVLSLLLGYVVWMLARSLSTRVLGRGKAIADRDEEELKGGSAEYEHTVLLCGPTSAGKTRLYYQIVFDANVDTVASIKANVAIVDGVRYMDWPGHSKLSSSLLRPVLTTRPRIVLVIDSTQPVAAAADCLHQLFSMYHALSLSSKRSKQPPIHILVLCHKSDLPSAKNEKRIQLQLRGELERLLKSQSSIASADDDANESKHGSTTKSWWPVGEPLDLAALPFVTLTFRATSCEGKGCKELVQEYCRTGTLSS